MIRVTLGRKLLLRRESLGVEDVIKVMRSVVANAAPNAAMILTTEALITDEPQEAPAMPAMPDGMDY